MPEHDVSCNQNSKHTTARYRPSGYRGPATVSGLAMAAYYRLVSDDSQFSQYDIVICEKFTYKLHSKAERNQLSLTHGVGIKSQATKSEREKQPIGCDAQLTGRLYKQDDL